MPAELSLTSVTAADHEWAVNLQLAAAMAAGEGAGPVELADGTLVVHRGAAGPCGLLVLRERLGTTNDLHVDVLPADVGSRDAAFRALRMITGERMDASPMNRVILELDDLTLEWADDLLGPCFVETARLEGARWMDGGWRDVTVLVCDARSWGRFETEATTFPSIDPA